LAWQTGALPPAPKAHLLLVLITFLPLTGVYIPFSVSIILHAAVTVYVGSWRSIKVGWARTAGAAPRSVDLGRRRLHTGKLGHSD